MTRRVFFSFHYIPDNWRAAQVRNIGAIEGNSPLSDNDWEKVKRGGDKAIKKWIDSQLKGRSCTVVLIGKDTANRKWIDYEIEKSWELRKGLLGIHVHHLKDSSQNQSKKGKNPFELFEVEGETLSNIVQVYDPPYKTSKNAYKNISDNISDWLEEAVEIRKDYK